MSRFVGSLVAGAVAVTVVSGVAVAVAVPVRAASEQAWQVTALYSQADWKTSKPRAEVLRACRTGTGGSPFAIGTPITVADAAETEVFGTSTVARVRLWKESGRWICKFIGTVPVQPNAAGLFTVRVGDTGGVLVGRGDVRADGWTVTYWP